MVTKLIAEEAIRKLISRRAETLLFTANYLQEKQGLNGTLTRPLLGQLMSQSTSIEELLDSYGAKNNKKWKPFRKLIGTIKTFSNIAYELRHVQHSLPRYNLPEIEQDFVEATNHTLIFVCNVLHQTSERLLKRARNLGLDIPDVSSDSNIYAEVLPSGRLPHDIKTRKLDNMYETITLLASAFLNLVEESKHLNKVKLPDDGYIHFASESLSEENLRQLKVSFHSLQSLYDTFISETEAENLDADLAVLRGHITVVYHLLTIATLFAHYFERHVRKPADSHVKSASIVPAKELLEALISYSISFAGMYVVSAQRLCHDMLKRYVKADKVRLLIPRYRGFHVRPSTLVAKIVLHYGTDVRMEFDDESCNAAVPIEIFRVNEKINAYKRCWLTKEISKMEFMKDTYGGRDLGDFTRNVIMGLAREGKLVIYEHPLTLPEHPETEGDVLLEYINREISRLLAEGKIDIQTEIRIRLVGDQRVLKDLKLLAEAGYGEDSLGNNIPLPKELVYLRK